MGVRRKVDPIYPIASLQPGPFAENDADGPVSHTDGEIGREGLQGVGVQHRDYAHDGGEPFAVDWCSSGEGLSENGGCITCFGGRDYGA